MQDFVTNTPEDAAKFERMYGDDSLHDSAPDFDWPEDPEPDDWLVAVMEDGPPEDVWNEDD